MLSKAKEQLYEVEITNKINSEEIEQFLCYLKLKDDYLKYFISNGVNSLENLNLLIDRLFAGVFKISNEESKKNLIIKNLNLILQFV
jgi:hypothetical protein